MIQMIVTHQSPVTKPFEHPLTQHLRSSPFSHSTALHSINTAFDGKKVPPLQILLLLRKIKDLYGCGSHALCVALLKTFAAL